MRGEDEVNYFVRANTLDTILSLPTMARFTLNGSLNCPKKAARGAVFPW
jgi:hypothetical protein